MTVATVPLLDATGLRAAVPQFRATVIKSNIKVLERGTAHAITLKKVSL